MIFKPKLLVQATAEISLNITENQYIEKRLHGHHIKFNMHQNVDLKAVLEDYKTTFQAQTLLFSYLRCQEAFHMRAQELRHPLIFYYGHTMTMYINKFVQSGLHPVRLNERFQTIFAIGVDQMGWDDLDQTHYDWPSKDQVEEYRKISNQIIINVITKLQDNKIQTKGHVWDILMCLQHHKIHIQTSSAIIRKVPISLIQSVPQLKQCALRQLNPTNIPQNAMIPVNPYHFKWNYNKQNADMYLFDNQMGQAQSHIKGFEISKFQVSNGQFLTFILNAGYDNPQFWTEQGKAWLKSRKRRHPIYWHVDPVMQEKQPENPLKYKLRTMSSVIDMPWNWPVEVNQLQAQAFCNWKGSIENKKYQLPTQQEFFAVRDQNIPNIYEAEDLDGNFDRTRWFSPCPVDYFKNENVYNIVGNTWQHTRTPFHAFSGFKVQSNFQDYSAPCFGQQHGMLFGGSFASGKKDAIVTRNWLRHHFYNFVGFRYTASQNQVKKYVSKQEENFFQYDDEILENIKLHYFDPNSYIHKFLSVMKENNFFTKQIQDGKALIAGVNVGRLALQLSKQYKQIFAIDYTARYFKICANFISKGIIHDNLANKTTLEQLGSFQGQNIRFMISNPQNPDLKKLDNFSLILVDSRGLRSKRIVPVIKSLKNLGSKCSKTKLVAISCQQNDNSISDLSLKEITDQQMNLVLKVPIQCQKGMQIYVFQL